MKRRVRRIFKGGTVVIGIALSAWGLILTFKNDTQPVSIQARFLWIGGVLVSLLMLFLIVAVYNQNKMLKEAGEYKVELCSVEDGNDILLISVIPGLNIDYAVTIAADIENREKVLGIGKIRDIQANNFMAIEIIRHSADPLWSEIENNKRSALNKLYILPTVRADEVKR